MALTGRKRAFADALLGGLSKTQAAIAAGLSEATAAQSGSRMAKDKDVVAYLTKAGYSPAPVRALGRGFTLPNGQKAPDAPADWPFGTRAPEASAPPAEEPKRRRTAREFLADLVNDENEDIKLRADAAKKLIEFEEAKPAPMGKKAAVADAARKVSKFTSAAPPLKAIQGGRA